jgi:DNA-binding SARP family transcriptional activator
MLRLFGATSYENIPLTFDRSTYLLALLVCQNEWITRDELTLLLWDDTNDDLVLRSRLRQLIYRVKQTPLGGFFESSQHGLRFTGISDVRQFCHAIEQCDWQTAINFYQGQLLNGAVISQSELGEWFALERATLSAKYNKAVLEQADLLDSDQALLLLEQALEHDPLNEDLLRALLHQAKTKPEVGQRAFEHHKTVLYKDLQLLPSEELQHLAAALVNHAPLVLPRAKLPSIQTAFVGRQAELDLIHQRFLDSHCRVLSLVGVGGIGKTRLALEVASRVPAQFNDGAVFVDLAKLADAELVPNAILEALAERPQQQPLERLKTVLANRLLLLVLDNFEHVLAAKSVVHELIEHTTGLCMLITSRESLGLRSEHVFDISGMPAPDTVFRSRPKMPPSCLSMPRCDTRFSFVCLKPI